MDVVDHRRAPGARCDPETLRLEGCVKRFGDVVAIDGVSLEVLPGQMVGVIGRSGAGKSTLLRVINRLVDLDAGRITFGARDVTALGARAVADWRTDCAMIFQQFNLVDRLDALTNVLTGSLGRTSLLPSLFKVFSDADHARAILALDRVGIAGEAFRRADTLSGGQQQRVAIARALMQRPRLILADEPVASLDPPNARLVMNIIRSINRNDGISVIVNLHSIEIARAFCGRIVGLYKGRKVFDGPVADLTQSAIAAIYGVGGPGESEGDETEREGRPIPQPDGNGRLAEARERTAGLTS